MQLGVLIGISSFRSWDRDVSFSRVLAIRILDFAFTGLAVASAF